MLSALSNSVRGTGRLAAVLGITLQRTGRLMAVRKSGQWTPGVAADHAADWGRTLCRVCGIRVNVSGEPPEFPVLFVANHRSYADIVGILSVTPCSFLAKSELRRWPVLGHGARVGNTLFVERGSSDSRRRARGEVAGRIAEGVSVVVFAEGTTTAGPGYLPFRPGVFVAAARDGIPVVPVAVSWDQRDCAWIGDDTFVPHFLRVFGRPNADLHVAFGPVMRGCDAEQLKNQCEHWISAHLAETEEQNN